MISNGTYSESSHAHQRDLLERQHGVLDVDVAQDESAERACQLLDAVEDVVRVQLVVPAWGAIRLKFEVTSQRAAQVA